MGVAVGVAAEGEAETTYCNSWAGSPVIKQQEVSSGAASLGLLVSMFISSQFNRTFEKGHPTGFSANNVEAASGSWLTPNRMKARAKMNNRRIGLQSTKFESTKIQAIICILLIHKDGDQYHREM